MTFLALVTVFPNGKGGSQSHSELCLCPWWTSGDSAVVTLREGRKTLGDPITYTKSVPSRGQTLPHSSVTALGSYVDFRGGSVEASLFRFTTPDPVSGSLGPTCLRVSPSGLWVEGRRLRRPPRWLSDLTSSFRVVETKWWTFRPTGPSAQTIRSGPALQVQWKVVVSTTVEKMLKMT